MACCGQKREALIQSSTVIHPNSLQPTAATTPARFTSFADARPAPPAMVPRPAGAAPVGALFGAPFGAPFGAVSLRYLARSPIVVRGPVSGIEYRFSAAQPVQRVARADREALLRTGHFSLHD